MLISRAPLKVIEEILGHSNLAQTATISTDVLPTRQLEGDCLMPSFIK
jgi:hypothetical protein